MTALGNEPGNAVEERSRSNTAAVMAAKIGIVPLPCMERAKSIARH